MKYLHFGYFYLFYFLEVEFKFHTFLQVVYESIYFSTVFPTANILNISQFDSQEKWYFIADLLCNFFFTHKVEQLYIYRSFIFIHL